MLLRALLPLFFAISLLSYDFDKCTDRVKKAFVHIDKNKRAIAISKDRAILFSKTKIEHSNIIKSDHLLGLYMFDIEPLDDDMALELWSEDLDSYKKELAFITQNFAKSGYVEKDGAIFYSFAKFSNNLLEPNVPLVSICYSLFGISVGDSSFIEPRYLDRFIKYSYDYSDIGVRVADSSGKLLVKYIDPFINFNLFQRGDEIIKVDGVIVKSLREFSDSVIDLPLGEKVAIEILRDGKILTLYSNVKKRFGGGLLSDTFLERVDLEFDNDFVLTKSPKIEIGALKWLKTGDKIKAIDYNNLDSSSDIKEILTNLKRDYVRFLIQRDGFDFFIKVDLSDLESI